MSKQFTPVIDRPGFTGGTQQVYRFPNGQGASVIRTPFSYGGDKGLFELAVLRFGRGDDNEDFGLDYSTPITDDVLGNLTEEQVQETLAKIEAL